MLDGFPAGPAALAAVGVAADSELERWIASEGGRIWSSVGELSLDVRAGAFVECVLLGGPLLDVLSDLLTLRDEPNLARVPVLTVVSQAADEQVAACVRAGAFYCFVEPVDRALLSAMLRAASALRQGPKSEQPAGPPALPHDLPHVKEIVLSVRSLADARLVSAFVSELCPQPARQALGVSELLLNAIEHGNLEISGAEKAQLVRDGTFQSVLAERAADPRYAEREVTVWLRRASDHVEIVCEDQGPGFDWKSLEAKAAADPDAPNGRGIALSRALAFDSLEYLGRGNVAVARARHERRPRRSAPHAFTALSIWETRQLELETDGVLERATAESFFADTLELALRASDSPAGFVGYLTESGDLVVAAGSAVTASPDASPQTLRLSPASWARIWWEALDGRRTCVENGPHQGFRAGARLERSLVVPIRQGQRLLGLVHVADRGLDYGEHDVQRLETVGRRLAPTLSAWISAELATSRRMELERERARQREEQEAARHIVSRLLRDGCLDGPGIRYHLAATTFFNGDLALAARLPGGGLRWMLGDCVGHGLPAAIGGLPLSSVFYATAAKGVPLSEVVTTMNDTLLALLPRGFFCAAVLLELSPAGDRVTIWNGGMPPAFVCSPGPPGTRHVHSENLPLGTVPSRDIESAGTVLEIEPETRILCFSDGLIETHSVQGELFGMERASAIVSLHAPDEVFEALLRALSEFRGDNPSFDDLSLVEVSAGAAAG
jgi:serine phosphatase RsbU (regulator of sigma subunit)/anti-sigma regulatory factor (Ser/Thr protein kinase)